MGFPWSWSGVPPPAKEAAQILEILGFFFKKHFNDHIMKNLEYVSSYESAVFTDLTDLFLTV